MELGHSDPPFPKGDLFHTQSIDSQEESKYMEHQRSSKQNRLNPNLPIWRHSQPFSSTCPIIYTNVKMLLFTKIEYHMCFLTAAGSCSSYQTGSTMVYPGQRKPHSEPVRMTVSTP